MASLAGGDKPKFLNLIREDGKPLLIPIKNLISISGNTVTYLGFNKDGKYERHDNILLYKHDDGFYSGGHKFDYTFYTKYV